MKQGSKGGPYQWNLVTRYILWKLAQAKGIQWIQTHITNFADDYHLARAGSSEIFFHRATCEMAEFFALLESFGLRINLGKSAAIVKVAGPRLHAFYKRFIQRRSDGVYLKCTTKQGSTYHVPVVKKWDYLGSVLSYHAYDTDTVARRVKAADHAFAKLKEVLGNRRSFPLAQRLAVYDACVWSTLTYAVLAVGLGVSEARIVHHLVIKHLRYIAHSPRHITKESNADLCTRLGRSLPLDALRHLWERKQQAWMERHQHLHLEDVVRLVPQYPDVLPALTMQVHAGLTMASSPSSHAWQCRTCGRGFHTSHALKTHCARAHPAELASLHSEYTYKPTRDSVPGTWQRAHCAEQFHRSTNLEYHISGGACQYFNPHRQEPWDRYSEPFYTID